MKYIIATLLLLVSSLSFADDSLVQGSLSGATVMFNQNEATGAQLGQASAQILQTAQTWQNDKAAYETANASLITEKTGLQSQVDHHKNWEATFVPEVNRYNGQCSGKQGDQDFVNQCNNWRAQLAPIKERFDADAARLNALAADFDRRAAANLQTHDALGARWAEIDKAVKANEVAGQAYLARRAQIIREMQQIVDNFNSRCQLAANSGNRELASETCGQAFDGNAVHAIHIPDLPSPKWKSFGASSN